MVAYGAAMIPNGLKPLLAFGNGVGIQIARRDAIERYATLFAEAGIRIGGLTCSPAAVYSALRLFGRAPDAGILAYEPTESGGVEMYGESAARPLFSASFDAPLERATALASAEMRVESESEPRSPRPGPG